MGRAGDPALAWHLLRRIGSAWDPRLQRYVARVPRARFPIVDDVEHETTAEVIRGLLAGVAQ